MLNDCCATICKVACCGSHFKTPSDTRQMGLFFISVPPLYHGLPELACFRLQTESKVGLYGEGELVYEDLLESGDVVLLVKDEHGFLVIYRINRTE